MEEKGLRKLWQKAGRRAGPCKSSWSAGRTGGSILWVDPRDRYGGYGDGGSGRGITLTGKEKRPLDATTYGVGEMILDAVDRGCRKFLIGIGGSATNDCGIGMLTALGYEFLDNEGKPVGICAKDLKNVAQIRKDQFGQS